MDGIDEFYTSNVMSYPQSINHPIHFVGSIAFAFEGSVRSIGESYNLNVKNIIRRPIDGLLKYHASNN